MMTVSNFTFCNPSQTQKMNQHHRTVSGLGATSKWPGGIPALPWALRREPQHIAPKQPAYPPPQGLLLPASPAPQSAGDDVPRPDYSKPPPEPKGVPPAISKKKELSLPTGQQEEGIVATNKKRALSRGVWDVDDDYDGDGGQQPVDKTHDENNASAGHGTSSSSSSRCNINDDGYDDEPAGGTSSSSIIIKKKYRQLTPEEEEMTWATWVAFATDDEDDENENDEDEL